MTGKPLILYLLRLYIINYMKVIYFFAESTANREICKKNFLGVAAFLNFYGQPITPGTPSGFCQKAAVPLL